MAVDVGSAVGYLDLDISGFSTGLKTAQSEASKASDNIATKLGGAMETVGGKMSAIGGLATAGITVPIATAVTASVKQFANLEQSIGGIETLFKKSAPKVIENSKTAYVRAGIDANNYMEQVTSFSATLLSNLNNDTVKAAEYADRAIVDMSDNANKMGTAMETISQTYQSLARGNYAMLDNLKLGYGGTKSEMERMIADANRVKEANGEMADLSIDSFADVTEAIHIIQNEMGITGTTAKEAEGTVTGSFMMMKASVLNFLQQLGNPGADMDKFTQAMVDSIGIFIKNVKRVLSTIWDNLPLGDLQKKLLVAAAAFGPVMLAGGKVISTVGKITTAVGLAIPKIISFAEGFKLARAGFPAFGAEASKLGAAIGGISAPVVAIIAVIALLVAAFVSLWKNNEDFRSKITKIWGEIKNTVSTFIKGIAERLNSLGINFKSVSDTIKKIWKGFCDYLAPIFTGAFKAISIALKTVTNTILGIMDLFIAVFKGDWKGAWDAVKSIFTTVWEGIKSYIVNVLNTIKSLFNVVLGWFGTSWKNCWNGVKSTTSSIFNSIKTTISNVLNSIKSTINSIISGIKSVFSNGFSSMKNTVSSVFDGIKNKISNIMNSVKSTVSTGVSKLKGMFNFSWSLPKIKLPHFKVTGGKAPWGFMGQGSLPSISVSWYKKAMTNGMILDSATIFGFNPKTGKFLGGGEAGSETVVGTKNLMQMIANAVKAAIGPMIDAAYRLASVTGELGYVTYNGFIKQGEAIEKIVQSKSNGSDGDTFVFYSPKPIDEIEAARQMKKTKRELAEGF